MEYNCGAHVVVVAAAACLQHKHNGAGEEVKDVNALSTWVLDVSLEVDLDVETCTGWRPGGTAARWFTSIETTCGVCLCVGCRHGSKQDNNVRREALESKSALHAMQAYVTVIRYSRHRQQGARGTMPC
jgi:hypothetical protein